MLPIDPRKKSDFAREEGRLISSVYKVNQMAISTHVKSPGHVAVKQVLLEKIEQGHLPTLAQKLRQDKEESVRHLYEATSNMFKVLISVILLGTDAKLY